MEAIVQRRSVRNFKPDPLPAEVLKQLVEAARLAPSGSNTQPWRFLVVTDSQERKQLRAVAASQKFIEEAPAVFVCCADLDVYQPGATRRKGQEVVLDGYVPEASVDASSSVPTSSTMPDPTQDLRIRVQSAVLNVAIAVEHIVLAAESQGLGSCWVGAFDGKGVRDMFGLPRNILVIALLPVGVPADVLPPRPRMEQEEILLRPLPAE
jgi:nitroreductase